MNVTRLILATLLLFSAKSYAGIYFEPYVGYETGTLEGTANIVGFGVNTFDEELTGIGFGAKLGYEMGALGFGVDYMSGKLDGDDQTSSNSDSEWDTTDLGVFFQYRFPKYVKFTATYFLTSDIEEDNTGSGSGFKVGLGFNVISNVYLNVEMIAVNYDEFESPGFTVNNVDVDRKTTMVSLSIPINSSGKR